MLKQLRLDSRSVALTSLVWLGVLITGLTVKDSLALAWRNLETIASVSAEPEVNAAFLKETLKPLPPAYAKALASLHLGEPQTGEDGGQHQIHVQSGVKPTEGMFMFDLVRRTGATATAEVGLANGVSALYFLAALNANGGGTHTAMDPFESSDWKGIALRRVQDLGIAQQLRFFPEFSSHALPKLAKEGARFQIIFIDGNHRFDDALVDFTLADQVVADGGIVLFHDSWMPSVQRALAFVEHNRSDYVRQESPVRNVAAFKKTGEDTRIWSHFVEF